MPLVALEGTHLSYHEVGNGLPWLVMHGGLGVDHTGLRDGLDPLGDVLRLVYYDHRGNGCSGRPPLATLTLAQLAADADALRRELGLTRVGVLAHSFGGCVALEYARRYAAHVSHLLLVGAWARFDYGAEIARALAERGATDAMLAALVSVPDDAKGMAERERLLAPLAFAASPAALHARVFRHTIWSPTAAARGRALLGEYDAMPHLGTIGARTLVVTGAADVYAPPSQALRIARAVPGAECVIFERSAHYPFVEEPEAFQAAVRDWLARAAVLGAAA